MDTHNTQATRKGVSGIYAGLAAFVVGSLIGFVAGNPHGNNSCPASALQAHFLEDFVAYDVPVSLPRARPASSAAMVAEALRPSATEPVAEPTEVPSIDSSSSAAAESSSIASSAASEPVSSAASSADAASSPSSSASSEASQSASSSSAAAVPAADFPAFGHAVSPVARVPNWGAMKTPAEWERPYAEMERADFVSVPPYRMADLTVPMADLLERRDEPESIRLLTAKLYYSTRYFGRYDLDGGEFEGDHAGVDLKLPLGTPVGAIAGGRVNLVEASTDGLGLHVIVEHRLEGETFYSVYGHLKSVAVEEGQDVGPGDVIGRSGSTGRSSGPHLHLQLDRGEPGETPHAVYWPGTTPTRAAAAARTVNPMPFIAAH